MQPAQCFRGPLYACMTATAVEVFPRNFCIYYEGRVRFGTAKLLLLPTLPQQQVFSRYFTEGRIFAPAGLGIRSMLTASDAVCVYVLQRVNVR
jgi:hypothetical protein